MPLITAPSSNKLHRVQNCSTSTSGVTDRREKVVCPLNETVVYEENEQVDPQILKEVVLGRITERAEEDKGVAEVLQKFLKEANKMF